MAQKVTSTDIKLALKEFHNGKPSYFITECKTCSTYFPDPQGLLKFDGLAITKSYTKPNIIGYEIKVSRNDFLQDNKWHLYLQYCNEFYFVVPKGLVKKEELPDHVGLIYFNPDTKGLRTVKKALYRQIEEPVGVYKYIIFSRLEEDRIPFYNDRAEYCKDYLEDKVVKSAIGVDNELLQSGKVYKIKTISVMWNGKPRLRVAFGERFRYWVHYGSLEEFLKRWKVEAVYHGCK